MGGNLVLAVPQGMVVQVVAMDAQGNFVGSPEAIVTQSQLTSVVASFNASLAQLRAQMALLNSTAAAGSSLQTETSRALVAEQSVATALGSEVSRATAAEQAEVLRATTAEASLAGRINSVSAQIPALATTVSSQTATLGVSLTSLTNTLSGQTVSLSSLSSQIPTLASTVSGQAATLFTLSAQLPALATQVSGQTAALGASLSSLTNTVSGQAASLSSLSAQLPAFATQVQVSSQTAALNASFFSLSSQIPALANTVSTQVTALSNTFSSLSTQIPTLTNTVASQAQQATALNTSLMSATASMQASLSTVVNVLNTSTLAEVSRARAAESQLNLSIISATGQQALLSASLVAHAASQAAVNTAVGLSVAQATSFGVQNTASAATALNTSLLAALSNVVQAQPALISSYLQCNSIVTVTNGNTTNCMGTLNTRMCQPTCNPGYALTGTLTCNLGIWTNTALCTIVCTPIANCAVQPTCTTFSNSACSSCSSGFALVAGPPDLCVTGARYWRLQLTQVTVAHYPRVSRYVLKRFGGAVINMQVFNGDNCADSGNIDGVGYVISYDFGTPTAVIAGGFYTVFSGLRGGIFVLEYSADNSNWINYGSRDLQTNLGCGIYFTDGTKI